MMALWLLIRPQWISTERLSTSISRSLAAIRGAGITGEKDDKYYQSGKLLEADSDDKYSVVKAKDVMMTPGIVNSELTPVEYDSEGKVVLEEGEEYTTVYEMLDDAEAFLKDAEEAGYTYLDKSDLETINETILLK